jgi:hypothetical protein
MAQAVSRRHINAEPGFTPWTVHVGFVVDKVALGQVFFEFFSIPSQYHPTFVLHTDISFGG